MNKITEDNITITPVKIAYHRNGISGAPFHVILFKKHEDGKINNMLGIVFEAPYTVAVLDTDLLADGTIEFMTNSWRGDNFAPVLREAIRQREGQE